MLSRDRLNMDVDKSVLELMLQLLNVETNRNSPEKTPQGKETCVGDRNDRGGESGRITSSMSMKPRSMCGDVLLCPWFPVA